MRDKFLSWVLSAKVLSVTRLQVQLSSIGMLVPKLLNIYSPYCNSYFASNCPRALRLPNLQVPKTIASFSIRYRPEHASKSLPHIKKIVIMNRFFQQNAEKTCNALAHPGATYLACSRQPRKMSYSKTQTKCRRPRSNVHGTGYMQKMATNNRTPWSLQP